MFGRAPSESIFGEVTNEERVLMHRARRPTTSSQALARQGNPPDTQICASSGPLCVDPTLFFGVSMFPNGIVVQRAKRASDIFLTVTRSRHVAGSVDRLRSEKRKRAAEKSLLNVARRFALAIFEPTIASESR